MRRLGYVPALDGVRAVAVAAVVLFHAGFIPSGVIGVDLFFVLSGFLITSLLLDEHAERGAVALANFYRRRARRLLPVAIAGIIFGETLTLAVSGFSREMIPGVFALFYAANLDHLFQPFVYDRFRHYWSLSQEEQFYLVWPPLLAWVLWRRVSLAKMTYILAALAGVVLVHRATSSNSLFGPDMRADGMLLGCSLAVGWKSGLLRPSPRWRLAGAVSAVVFAVAATTMPTSSQSLYGITVGVIASAVMVASIILEPLGPLPRLLASRPLVWLGKISYSLYIWHIFVAQAFSGLSMIAVSIPVAWLSYRLIEQPFRRRRAPTAAAPLKQHLSPAAPAV